MLTVVSSWSVLLDNRYGKSVRVAVAGQKDLVLMYSCHRAEVAQVFPSAPGCQTDDSWRCRDRRGSCPSLDDVFVDLGWQAAGVASDRVRATLAVCGVRCCYDPAVHATSVPVHKRKPERSVRLDGRKAFAAASPD